MKRYESDSYKACGLDGGHYLATYSDDLNGVKEEIDRSNKRAVELGYDAQQWLITHVEWYTWHDDNGRFVKSETYETAVEVYPQSLA